MDKDKQGPGHKTRRPDIFHLDGRIFGRKAIIGEGPIEVLVVPLVMCILRFLVFPFPQFIYLQLSARFVAFRRRPNHFLARLVPS